MFKIGDKVIGCGNPFDEQLEGHHEQMVKHKTVQTVTNVQDSTLAGTSGQWIRTNLQPDWMDKDWFRKAE